MSPVRYRLAVLTVYLCVPILNFSGLQTVHGQGPPSPTVDELLVKLADVRTRRGELERQERELVGNLRERIAEQQRKLIQMGVSLETTPPLPPVAQPLPTQPVQPPVPRVPATLTEELAAAYQADKLNRRGGEDDLRALVRIYENAGQALDKARPPTVGHLRNGVDIIIRVQLKQQLPGVITILQRQLALRFPEDGTVLNASSGTACKLVLLEVASSLEKVVH